MVAHDITLYWHHLKAPSPLLDMALNPDSRHASGEREKKAECVIRSFLALLDQKQADSSMCN